MSINQIFISFFRSSPKLSHFFENFQIRYEIQPSPSSSKIFSIKEQLIEKESLLPQAENSQLNELVIESEDTGMDQDVDIETVEDSEEIDGIGNVSSFACHICYMMYDSFEKCVEHMHNHHVTNTPSSTSYDSDNSSVKSPAPDPKTAVHRPFSDKKKIFQCIPCGKCYSRQFHAVKHQNFKKHKYRQILCKICKQSFTGDQPHECAEEDVNRDPNLTCEVCRKTFKSLIRFKVHQLIHDKTN